MKSPGATSAFGRPGRRLILSVVLVGLGFHACWAAEVSVDPEALFARAVAEGRVGTARKSKPVDARAAAAGEVVVTVIAGEGKETQSPPAKLGDMVVRNRCEATGHEQYLVAKDSFARRYQGPLGPADQQGWQPYRPLGAEMLFVAVGEEDGAFTFTAPWGEEMTARPGDVLVRDPANPDDTYRVAAAAFECTYEILRQPQ